MMKILSMFDILILIALGLYPLGTRRTWERQEQSPADSTLANTAESYLCGNHNRSLMGMFRGRDDLEVICVNDW